MPLEEAFKLLEWAPRDTASLSAEDARKLREAYLVMRGDLAEDEIRAALEADFGPQCRHLLAATRTRPVHRRQGLVG